MMKVGGSTQHKVLTFNWYSTREKVSQPLKHSPTSIPEHPARKVLALLGIEPRSSVYMTDALPTELLITPAERSDITLTDGS